MKDCLFFGGLSRFWNTAVKIKIKKNGKEYNKLAQRLRRRYIFRRRYPLIAERVTSAAVYFVCQIARTEFGHTATVVAK